MNDNGLSAKQKRAIAALLTAGTVKRASKVCHISMRQIFRWLENADFRKALDAAADDCIGQVTRMLADSSGTAVLTLRAAMTDSAAPVGAKVRAADVTLAHLLKVKELAELQARIARLEETVNAERHIK